MDEIPFQARGALLVVALCALAGSASAQQAGIGPDSAAHSAREPEYHATTARRSRAVGASSTILTLDSLAPTPLGTFSNVLSSRIPGVLVEQPSGATGAGARIHIRGINSLVLPGNPLVIVDGVRVANATTISTVNAAGQTPSLLDALDPEEIERIAVLPGPAAAATYGGDAADGVILISTRRGRPGRPVWRLHSEYGAVNDITTYPSNFGRVGTNRSTGQPMALCSLDLEYQGVCVPGPLTSWNPIENVSPFHTGSQQRHGLSASGGSGPFTFYTAGDFDREDGVYADNERLQSRVRAGAAGHVGRALDLAAMASYADGMVRLPVGGGAVGNGLFGAAADDPVTRGYSDPLSDVLHSMQPSEYTHQYMLGLTAEWQPLRWLRSASTIGYNRTHLSSDDRREFISPAGGTGADSVLNRATGAYWTDALTVQSGVESSHGNAASLSASSAVGFQYHRGRMYDRSELESRVLNQGSSPLSDFSTTELHGDASTTGVYVQQQLAWRQRFFLAGGLRRDWRYHQFTAAPSMTRTLTDGSASLAWIISSEPFFPHAAWLNTLRLRASYGQTSRYLDPVVLPPAVLEAVIFGGTAPPPGGDGPRAIAPERTREIEAGLDIALAHDRVDAALTYYDKRDDHLAVLPPYVTSSGYGTIVLLDEAALRNHGYEMRVHVSPVHSRAATAEITFTGATNHNTLAELNAPPFALPGSAQSGYMQRMVAGYPVAGYWDRRYTFADMNGDGIISRDEVQLDSAASFLGSAVPTRELSAAPAITFLGRITLSALVDYRGGFRQYDANDAYRCRSLVRGNCRAAFDATAPLADQAAAVASDIGSNAGFVDDASFWKLREVAVTLAAPHRWAERVAASDVRLTLAGRNLATWTSYPGLDPEMNATPSNPLVRGDFATQPPVRYLTARIDVTW